MTTGEGRHIQCPLCGVHLPAGTGAAAADALRRHMRTHQETPGTTQGHVTPAEGRSGEEGGEEPPSTGSRPGDTRPSGHLPDPSHLFTVGSAGAAVEGADADGDESHDDDYDDDDDGAHRHTDGGHTEDDHYAHDFRGGSFRDDGAESDPPPDRRWETDRGDPDDGPGPGGDDAGHETGGEGSKHLEPPHVDGDPSGGGSRDVADHDPRRTPPPSGAQGGRDEGDRSHEDQRTEKAVAAAATAMGVPAPIAGKLAQSAIGRKLGRNAKKIVALPLVLALLIGVAIFSGSFSSGENLGGVYEVGAADGDFSLIDTIPDPYLEAYREAGRTAGVPWTLLAAIGQRASDHGRVNPYESNVPPPGGGSSNQAPGDITKIFHVGDSLGYGMQNMGGAKSTFTQRGVIYNSRLEPGKRIEWATGEIAKPEYDDELDGADVLVNLGTNDWTRPIPTFERDIDAFMSTLAAGQRVWWFTLHRTGSEEYNAALLSATTRWPNLRIVDWAAYALENGILPLESDPLRLHYGRTGYTSMVDFAVTQLLGNGTSTADPTTPGQPDSGQPESEQEDVSCPTLAAPIVGETANQGAGPLMLKPAVLEASSLPLGDRVQNICDSAEALASIMADTAALLAEEKGLSWPRGVSLLAARAGDGDAEAAQQTLSFWQEVVDRLTVLGTVNRVQCDFGATSSLPAETQTGSMIHTYWTCELNNHPLESVATVTVTDGVVSHELLPLPQAVSRSVQEALSVAWTWSAWGKEPCDAAAEIAGVFPLRQRDFDAHVPERFSNRDRCDVRANIAAAAALFAAGETVPASVRPGVWSSSIGGWENFAWVTGRIYGQVEGPTPFDREGPWSPLQTSAACRRILVNELVKTAGQTTSFLERTAAVVQSYISEGIPEDIRQGVDADLFDALERARNHPSCRTDRSYLPAEWFASLSAAFNGDALSNPETGQSGTDRLPDVTAGELTVPAGTGDKAAALARRASDLGEEALPAAEVGSTPLLQRLSHGRILVELPPVLPRVVVGEGLTRGAEIVNIASTTYGGVFVGQRAAGTGSGFGLLGGGVLYAEVFNTVGQETGVDPRMLAAIAFQESNFNIASRCDQLDLGEKQGYGMMQKDLGPSQRAERELVCQYVDSDPDAAATYQVRQAADLFKAFLDRVGGDVEGALLAYNSGAVLGRYWATVKPDLEALRTEARRYWCEENPTGWSNLARDGLRGCEARGDVTVKYISPEPGTRSAINKYREYVQQFPGMVLTGSQTGVSGSECPDTATSMIPGKTILRGGSASIGLRQLCIDSVAQAATPEAAQAIIFVFNHLGNIYDQPRRAQRGYFDCSSYVTRAYESAGVKMSHSNGWLFTTHYLMAWDGQRRPEWITEVSAFDARPGDLAFPKFGHVEMLLAHGYYAHAPAPGDVTHIHRAQMIQFNRVNPSMAPRLTEPRSS